MKGTFGEGIDELHKLVGAGTLKGSVEFDQVYAFNQHEGYWVDFMGHLGPKSMQRGRPHFLSAPLTAGSDEMMRSLADHLLKDGPVLGMIEATEKLAVESAAATPVEFGDLADSAHPVVTDDNVVVYDRPPIVPRLDESQLDAKARKTDKVRDYLPHDHPAHGTVGPFAI